ncbi:hypothetical protein [Streptomyces sp. KL116D]|uniref:hypothetical protein n=1 Tax=Streptomyces sp. KL116D TaxID=3045152 RepID=UPI0035577200
MSDSLRELWLRGIAFNPTAPSDVLIRLLDQRAGEAGLLMCEGRDLPDAVVDAALHHPTELIRRALARNQHVDPALLAPLAADPSGLVRANLAAGPRDFPRWVRPLPDGILVALFTARDAGEDGRLTADEIIGELVSSRQIPLSFPRRMAGHEHPALRVQAALRWTSLTPAQRVRLLADPDPSVQQAAQDASWALDPERVEARLPSLDVRNAWVFQSCALSDVLVEQCFADGTEHLLTGNQYIPAHAVARLARHPEPKVRALVATRPDLGPDLVAELRRDPDDRVRARARLQSSSHTWTEYETIQRIIGHGPDCLCPLTEPFARSTTDPTYGPSPDWFAACAVSEEPNLRRAAASWPGLSAELVEVLAQDGDEEVRIRLACHHPLAPPHLLLDVFVNRPAHRPHLLSLPAFPRTGWAHLIDHPDPEVRALAASDPALREPPVQDPDATVCRAAATNPNLAPATLESLLADPRTAEGAAANLALSASRLHALLDRCLQGIVTRQGATHP